MIFSKSSEYAIRAVMYICQHSKDEHRLNIKEIAREINSPEYFTSKILQQLVRQKIIASSKGPNGGFYISDNSKPISIYKIAEAIDGPEFFDKCILGLSKCSDKNPCPMHQHYVEHKAALKKVFMEKTIAEILADTPKHKINLK